MAVIVGAIPIAGLLMHWTSPLAWLGAVLLAAGPFVGYVVSRSIGLPGDSPDIGNWLDTLGMVSMFLELSVIGLGLTALVLAGYVWSGAAFPLWLAAVSGGGFILCGLWMRRA